MYGKLTFHFDTHKLLEPVLKKFDVRPAFKSEKLRNILRSPKDPTPPNMKSGVYEISCQGCNEKYIGMTKRTIEKRLKEHKLQFRNKEPQKSAVAHHLIQKRHRVEEISTKLLKHVTDCRRLPFWESMLMRTRNDVLMNMELPIASPLYSLIQR